MIPFTKAHACGNDFLVVSCSTAPASEWPELTRRLCARNTGVGADGIEFFESTALRSGRVRLHNADGSIAEISGNGTRCVAAFMAFELGAHPGDDLHIETDAGVRVCHINAIRNQNEFSVDVTTGMGVPSFAPHTVTLPAGIQVPGVVVSTGNPHFIILVDNADFNVAGQTWQSVGQQICNLPDFPHQTNVEFIRIIGPNEIALRIFERGVGPTTSSGTGTSASATAAIAIHGCTSPLTVVAPGGPQTITWDGPAAELFLTGPASLITRGEAW